MAAAGLLTSLLLVLPLLHPETAGRQAIVSLLAVPLLTVDLLIFIIALCKKNSWKWPYGVLLLLSLPCISGCFALQFSLFREAKQPESLTILGWNAEGFKLSGDTLAKAAAFICGQKPAIICLQERPHTNLLAWDSVMAAFKAYPHSVKNSREDEVLNLAIFSKWPLGNVKEYYFPDSYNKIIRADIAIGGNRKVRLFNVHLQTTGINGETSVWDMPSVLCANAARRNAQADMLRREISRSPYPVIVSGDFNDTPTSYSYRTLRRTLQDCFLKAGCGLGGSYQPLGCLMRIDYTLCSDDFEVSDYTLFENNWSDHKIQKTCISFRQARRN